MTLFEIRKKFIDDLLPLYGNNEANSLFAITAAEVLGYKPFEISLNASAEVGNSEKKRFDGVKARLLQYEPVQYVFGHAWFNGMRFKVDQHTLIPRQETEELVSWIKQYTPGSPTRILDIGTGSGCIAISLSAFFKNAEVYAVDIDEQALVIAAENASINNVKVSFSQGDILSQNSLEELLEVPEATPFDIIVSNPPYVRELEKKEITPNVLDFEPSEALFVSDEDPLIFYRKITELASKNLLQGGYLFFEINQYLGQQTKALVESFGFSQVELRSDLLGNHRMIKAIK